MDTRTVNKLRFRSAMALCVVYGFAASTLATPPMFVVESLPALGDGDSMALGMNKYGEIVGWSQLSRQTAMQAVLWTVDENTANVTPLGTLGGSWSEARAVNDHGQVIGLSEDADGQVQAFYYYAGTMWSLTDIVEPAPSGDADQCNSMLVAVAEAHAVNDRGWIVGAGRFEGEEGLMPLVLMPNFTYAPDTPAYYYQYLGLLPRSHHGIACAINDYDQVVGASGMLPFTWSDNEMHALQWSAGQGLAINNNGVIAGCTGATQPRACLWVDGERVELEVPKGWSSEVRALNDSDQAVGYATKGFKQLPHGRAVMLWDADGSAWDLAAHTLVPLDDLELAGFEFYHATGINDRSEIIGHGWTTAGQIRAVRLVPLSCPD